MTYSATVEQVSLQDPGRNSDKYYSAYVIHDEENPADARVMFRWGRRGSKGQVQVQVCHSLGEAQIVARNKLDSKYVKGYNNNLPTDGRREIERVPWDLLEMAGIDGRSLMPAVVDRTAVFADFAGEVDRAVRLTLGTPEEQGEALNVRVSLREQLDFLRTSTLKAEGAFELLEDVLYSRMEAGV